MARPKEVSQNQQKNSGNPIEGKMTRLKYVMRKLEVSIRGPKPSNR
jgi:hypothetical protein